MNTQCNHFVFWRYRGRRGIFAALLSFVLILINPENDRLLLLKIDLVYHQELYKKIN